MTTQWLAETARAAGFTVAEGTPADIVRGIADSRLAQPGDLFGAFPGEQADGNAFVASALERGATAAVCERMPDDIPPGATVVQAPSTVTALHTLAGAWRDACNPTVIGVTGTVGKTTSKEAIAGTLATVRRVHRSTGNFNSREGLPLALVSLRASDEVSVLEMGMDSPGEIAELAAVAKPDIGIVLNVGMTHASKLGSIDAIANEKLSLVRSLAPTGTAILNIDDPRIAAADGLACKVITFGLADGAQLRASDVTDCGLLGIRFTVEWQGERLSAKSPVAGTHTLPAALASIAACLALDMTLTASVEALGKAAIEGRLQPRISAHGFTVLDDRYNSSPASLTGALGLLAGLSGQRVALVGAMAELGIYEIEEHRKAGQVAARSCDALMAVGELGREIIDAAREAGLANATWYADKDEAARAILAIAGPGDHVLLKASRSQALETVLPLLLGDAS